MTKLEKEILAAKTGDEVFICHMPRQSKSWEPGYGGNAIIQLDGRLLRNAEEVLHAGIQPGKGNEWRPHPSGVIVKSGDKFWVNQGVSTQEEWDRFPIHLDPSITFNGNKFLHNGKVFFKGLSAEQISCPDGLGVMVRKRSSLYLVVWKG